MDQMNLGSTGVHVSAIGFGGMPLSIQGRPPESQAREVLHAALDEGITFIDTADVYCLDDDDIGHNERLIASVVSERRERDVIRIATKGGLRRPRGAWTNDADPKHLRQACEASLRALGTERIFLYQLHAPDPKVPFGKSVEALASMQREGKIEHVGLSNVSVAELQEARRIVEVVSVQNRLNVYFREAVDDGVVAECDRAGITFLAYSPLGGGRLSRKIPDFPVLTEMARRRGVTPFAVALAWTRAKGKTVLPIPGASKVASARDSARSSHLHLNEDELEAIDAARFSRA